MNTAISLLVEAGKLGDWEPLLEAAAHATDPNWAEGARCAGQDIDMFFPQSEHAWSTPQQVRRAEGIAINHPLNFCADCPLAVQARCLVETLRHEDEYGIRAGLLASERGELLDAWKQRVDSEAVSMALRGVPTLLNSAEREAVIATVASGSAANTEHARRGLGITSKYLWQLVREHRERAAA